ncbi:hypothetical protein B5V02_17945 [Mesorhizobium kowhaii]|uniref:Uncharacterized protein n=1 Tax=Mesorhizobium kowhaii TaxID=1300272 RepID=A0A2W7E167_9HYPH|nr:hypothetical protein B5V02_17945 [Mesorhizobium kowhaii]
MVPPVVPRDAGMLQIHSSAYRNPEQLPKGAVLVVGAGSSDASLMSLLDKPMPMSLATGSIFRKSPRPAGSTRIRNA